MTLQQLIDLSQIRELDSAGQVRLEQARQRQREYDREIENQVANKAVSQELLAKVCNL